MSRRLRAGRMTAMALGVAALVALAPVTAATAAPAGPVHPSRPGGPPGPDRTGAVVDVATSPVGQVLVVGGAGAGFVPADPTTDPPTSAHYNFPAGSALYFATVDPPASGGPGGPPVAGSPGHGYQAGCTTVVDATVGFACTGSATADSSEWPAFTTVGRPMAGPGVDQRLLGTVFRSDLDAFQVTYNGHPLYLFDPGPDSFFGADFFETVLPLPPWHTAWYLIQPNGRPEPGPATLEVEPPADGTSYSSPALGTVMLPTIGGAVVTVYEFSADNSHESRCMNECSRTFMPVLTDGTPVPGDGVNGAAIGTIVRHDGTTQVTYNGHPLYIYSQEQALVGGGGPVSTGTVGNGDGVSAFGGTFSVLAP